MKLWQVIQWGNADGGPNEEDTQVVISAIDMASAIKMAENIFEDHYKIHNLTRPKPVEWTRKEADVVFLLGEDNRPDGDPVLIIRLWEQHAFNPGNNRSWHRRYETGAWVDPEVLFGK